MKDKHALIAGVGALAVGTALAMGAYLRTGPISDLSPSGLQTEVLADSTPGPMTKAAPCDPSLAAHVYKPTRLVVKQPCMTVTGILVDATHGKRKDGVRKEADGDSHGWLKPDSQFKSLLDAGNMSNEDGNLVFEIVCMFSVSQADAKAACAGFKSGVALPPVGSHVAITGVYVEDQNHAKWREIHPVTSIRVIP